jgi:CRP/FNR family transcriptional regulator, cyclic AMP receptor protein
MTTSAAHSKPRRVLPQEKKPLILLALIFILFKTGLEISGNFAEVIYFRRVGVDSLPLLYSVEPLAMVIVLVVFGLIVDLINRQKLLLILNLAFAVLLIITRFLILADWPQVYFALYISQRIFSALLPLAFWLLCSDLFDIRQAKRLFVLIVASGLVGTLFGNLLTGFLSGLFTPEGTLALISLLFIASIGVGVWLSRLTLPKSFVKPKLSTDKSFSPILPLDILKQPFIQMFTLLILITGMLEPVWRYELNAIANQSFAAESNLIAFYGYFKGAAVIVVILFQLFLAGKLIEKMGVPWSLSMHPLGLIGIMLLLGIYPLLWMAVASVALIGIVRIGFDESGRKTIVGIYPLHERSQVSTYERQMTFVGVFLGGLFLIWAVERLSLMQINLIAAAFAATWFFVFTRFRKQYAQACLRRGRSPLDHAVLPSTTESEQAAARFELFAADLPPTAHTFLIQGAGLQVEKINQSIAQSLIRAKEQAIPLLQIALQSPIWSVRQFSAQTLLDMSNTNGGADRLITTQLDYADQLAAWSGITQIHKLITERRAAAARASLLLLEGLYPAGDLRVAARMLRSPVPDLRASGLEALDITLRGTHKNCLMMFFESLFAGNGTHLEDTPTTAMAQIGEEMALSPDSEVAFWGQVWRLRCGKNNYSPPGPDAHNIPADDAALFAAVIYPQKGEEAMILADKIDALRESETFAAISETELRIIAQCASEGRYTPDEVIFEEGQQGSALYVIMDGHVELASVEEKKSLQALGPGAVFGEHALFTEEPYPLTAVTISDCRLLILEREVFLELIQYYPNIAISLLKNLAKRFEKATELLQKVWV